MFDGWMKFLGRLTRSHPRKSVVIAGFYPRKSEFFYMNDFAAIDFETANNERSSVCSVGLVIVRGGEIVDKFYSLIKPEPEYYN